MDGKMQVTQVTAFPTAVLVKTHRQIKKDSIFKMLNCSFEQWLYSHIEN